MSGHFGYDGWTPILNKTKRTMDSIIFDDKYKILSNLKEFIKSSEW